MTENTTTTDTPAEGVDLQAKLDEFLALVHKTADNMGYCAQYEQVLKAAAEANPDKLEYVEPPVVTTLTINVGSSLQFPEGQDPEAEFKAWCEANGKEYQAFVPSYTADGKGDALHYTKGYDKGYVNAQGQEAQRRRNALRNEWVQALLTAGDPRVQFSRVGSDDPSEGSKRQVGRGRLVCKTATA